MKKFLPLLMLGLAVSLTSRAQFNGIVISNATCHNFCNGRAAVTGMNSNYALTWDDHEQSDTATQLCAGTHYCYIHNNAYNIFDTVIVTITQPATSIQVTDSVVPATCANRANGAIYATASGGVPPYTYLWGGGFVVYDTISGPDSSVLHAYGGTGYTVVATDANGCSAEIYEITVLSPAPLNVAWYGNNTSNCVDSNGGVLIEVTGGTQPYRYLWANGDTTDALNNLANGGYFVTVTDNNGCSTASSGVVNANSTFNYSINTSAICNGNQYGTATVVIFNATAPPYRFFWYPNGDTTATDNYLGTGYNEVSITDSFGCVTLAEAQIFDDGMDVTVTASGPVNCQGAGASATANVTGATGNVTYLWSDYDDQATTTGYIGGDSLYVTVSDAGGCVVVDSVLVPYSPNSASDSIGSTLSTCNNQASTVTIITYSVIAPYVVNWGDGTINSQVYPPFRHVYNIPGVYTVLITDSTGCAHTDLIEISSVSFGILLPGQINPTCTAPDSGSISFSVVFGTPPFQYVWNTGNSGSTTDTAVLSNLGTGNYSVTVTDANNCTASHVFNLTSLTPDFGYYVYVADSLTQCNTDNAVATAGVSGQHPPFTYLWNTTPPQTTATAVGLGAGGYNVTITDSLNCSTYGHVNIGSNCHNTITGTLFYDSSGQCVPGNNYWPVTTGYLLANGSQGSFYGSPDSTGFYTIQVPDNGPYTLQVITLYGGNCINPVRCDSNLAITFDSLNSVSAGNNFAYTFSTGFDLSLHPGWNSADPGFVKEYWVYYFNSDEASPFTGAGQVFFQFDSNLTFLSSDTPYTTFNSSTHTLGWDVATVTPGWQFIGYIYLAVPANLNPDYNLQSKFWILPTTGDCDSANNTLAFSEIVTGSHDPNEKTVSPAGQLTAADTVLTYTIHFQNTGTDTAWFITVVDTLPSGLNPGTVVNLASSMPYSSFKITGTGILTWLFNPAFLPDSFASAQNSKGFVTFSVHRYSNLADNTTISNKAFIYFDYNAPVVTNIAADTVVTPLSIISPAPLSTIAVTAFPNPFSDITNIEITGLTGPGKYNFELYDVTGRLQLNIPSATATHFQIGRGKLAAGIYTYRLAVGEEKVAAFGKLVIQ